MIGVACLDTLPCPRFSHGTVRTVHAGSDGACGQSNQEPETGISQSTISAI